MPGGYLISVEGFEHLGDLQKLPDSIKRNLARAINTATRNGRSRSGKQIREKVNLPARYVSGNQSRLSVTKQASSNSLFGTITGRQRPTSLARFMRGSSRRGQGVTVEVAPGAARYMKSAFTIRLRKGNALTDTQHNLGVAIRLKPGQSIRNKRKMVQIERGLYLLYGPSVDQVFKSVAEGQRGPISRELESEFLRLTQLELN